MKKVLCLIPARGGSKRLKKKNKIDFGGQSLFKWSINAANDIQYSNLICLSTDDEEIISESKEYSNLYIHKRENEYSNDKSSIEDLCDFLLNSLSLKGFNFEYLILLQPTSPLRERNIINDYLKIVIQKNANGLIELEKIKIATGLIKNGIWIPNQKPEIQSQMLDVKYKPSGRFYIYKIMNNKIIKNKLIGIDIGNKCSNNIDTIQDYDSAIGNLLRSKGEFDYLRNN